MNDLLDRDGWEISAAVRAEAGLGDRGRPRSARAGVGRHARRRLARHRGARAARGGRGRRGRSPPAGPSDRPLVGVPVGWKDLIDTAGDHARRTAAPSTATTCPTATPRSSSACAPAGAITVAKLATHELAWGTTTQNPHFGSCRNPHDPTRVPGGSSGGSGAALAAGWSPPRPAPTPAARSAAPRRAAASSASSRRSAASAWPASIRCASSLDHCGPMGALGARLRAPARGDGRLAAPRPARRRRCQSSAGASGLAGGVRGLPGGRRRALLLRAHRARHRRPARGGGGGARARGRRDRRGRPGVADAARRGRPVHPRGGGDAGRLLARAARRASAPTSPATSRSPRGWGRSTSPQTNQIRLEYARAHAREARTPPGSI